VCVCRLSGLLLLLLLLFSDENLFSN